MSHETSDWLATAKLLAPCESLAEKATAYAMIAVADRLNVLIDRLGSTTDGPEPAPLDV